MAVITRSSRFTSCFRTHSISLLGFVPKLKFSPLQLLLKLAQVHPQQWASPLASTCKYLEQMWQEDQTHCDIWQSTFVPLLTIKFFKKLQGLNDIIAHKFQKDPNSTKWALLPKPRRFPICWILLQIKCGYKKGFLNFTYMVQWGSSEQLVGSDTVILWTPLLETKLVLCQHVGCEQSKRWNNY